MEAQSPLLMIAGVSRATRKLSAREANSDKAQTGHQVASLSGNPNLSGVGS